MPCWSCEHTISYSWRALTSDEDDKVLRPAMKRFRKAALAVGLGTNVGLCVFAGRLFSERMLWRVPDAAILFSAFHSEWAWVFILGGLCALIAPLTLLIVGAYAFADEEYRRLWVWIAIILVIGLSIAYAPESLWHLLASQNQ